MSLHDDDLPEPLSSRRALERADHGKKEKAEARKRAQEKKELSKLKLEVLRRGMAPRKPAERNASTSLGTGAEAKGEGMVTKTREEELRQATENVHSKPDAEAMLRKAGEAERRRKEASYEQSKDKTS